MKVQEFYKAVVEQANNQYTITEIKEIIAAIEDVIMNTLTEDHNEKIKFAKLGVFSAKDISEKEGLSFITGKHWKKAPHTELTFSISETKKNI